MKNLIISVLTVIILNMQEGWQCEGVERVLISTTIALLLIVILAIIDTAYEEKQRKAENNDRVRKLQSR